MAKRALVVSSPVDSAGAAGAVGAGGRRATCARGAGAAEEALHSADRGHALAHRRAELVPGSTNASSLNSASGANVETSSSITPGTAVPIAADNVADGAVTTAVLSWVPAPMTRAISGG